MTRLYILTAVGIVGPIANAALVVWLINRQGRLRVNPRHRRTEWHPHDTDLDSVMRRRRWYGWQTRPMTPDELRSHVESRLRCWLGQPDDAPLVTQKRPLDGTMDGAHQLDWTDNQ
jgi:hypothetical protein